MGVRRGRVLGIRGGMAGPLGAGLLLDGWLEAWESRLVGFGWLDCNLFCLRPVADLVLRHQRVGIEFDRAGVLLDVATTNALTLTVGRF